MPKVRSIIMNSSLNILYSSILSIVSCLAAYIIYRNHKIFTQLKEIDLTSLFLLCFGIVTIIVLTSFIHLLLLFHFENFASGHYSNVLSRLWKHIQGHFYLCIFVLLDVGLMFLYLTMGLKFHWGYFLVIISASMLCACVIVVADYDDVDLSSSQNMEKSIGAFWAYGAYLAFYEKILNNITNRMSQFEGKHKIELLVQKLVIICPLSCNANGSLEGRDGNIKVLGHLDEIIEDEGANNNRSLKTNVYRICGPPERYIAAEIPSPLATLYGMRDVMDNTILQYHRECFIETLRNLLKSNQCIILEYDDLNSQKPLHSFLLSKLEDNKFVSVMK